MVQVFKEMVPVFKCNGPSFQWKWSVFKCNGPSFQVKFSQLSSVVVPVFKEIVPVFKCNGPSLQGKWSKFSSVVVPVFKGNGDTLGCCRDNNILEHDIKMVERVIEKRV